MKKAKSLLLMLGLSVLAVMNTPVTMLASTHAVMEGETSNNVLTVVSNSNSGIYYAYYTGSLPDGSLLGFYKSGSNIYFCGAISSAASLSVPEKISFNGTEYTVSYCGGSSGSTLDFDEATSVTSLTLPSTITNIINYIPSTVYDLHLHSETPPSMSSGYRYINSATTVWVPESAYSAYQSLTTVSNSSWYGVEVLYEGWKPQSYMVTVNTAGTFAYQILAAVEQWTDVNELTVIGHLNEEDMGYFSRLTQLMKLDLSQTDITTITGLGGLKKLQTVLLPSTVKTIGGGAFSNCLRLENINLSNVETVEANAFSSCSKLMDVDLSNVRTIDDFAFSACKRLTELNLPKAETIGMGAFVAAGVNTDNLNDYNIEYAISYYRYKSGSNIVSVSLPSVKTIGVGAFAGNEKMTSLSMPKVEVIANGAFMACVKLTEVNLSSVKSLGSYAFCMKSVYDENNSYSCPQSILSKVILPDDLTVIPAYCFYGCTKLSELNFPSALTSIHLSAIPYLAKDDIVIPEGVASIGGGNFTNAVSLSIPSTAISIGSLGGEKLTDVYCYRIMPYTSKVFSDNYAAKSTLHVPAFSVAAYKLDDNWYKFGKIVAMEETIDKLTINNNFTIVDYTGLADKVDMNLTLDAHLTVSAGSAFNLGTFTQTQSTYANNGDYYYDDWGNRVYYGGISTLIANNEMKADNVDLHLQVPTNRWNFISLPFDVKVADIEYPEGTLWVIRKYSGADRAALTGNTWQNMTDGMTLQAGEGYILHCANESTSRVEFVFHAVDNAQKNNIFAYQDVVKPLATYASEYAHNRSWNLVGNPYPAYFDTHSIDHNGVITVYSNNSSSYYSTNYGYTAYSLLDDDYVLRPNEAFFVQCPTDATCMTFKAEGRMHENNNNGSGTTRIPRRVATSNSNRHVYNFTLTNGDFTDRARLVINPEAKMDYEINCDASKFMSDELSAPQLYVYDNGIRYAIDERPLGDGIVTLGAHFGKMGEYTITLKDNPTNGEAILLTDYETGEQVNLADRAYTFTAQTGTNDNRFTLKISGVVTDIYEIVNSKSSNSKSLYDLQGRKTDAQQKGIYVVKDNGKSRKVLK